MSESEAIAQRLLDTTTDLPALDPVVTRVLELVSDLETRPGELADEITRDPSLSARILKLSNSALLGMPREIDSLERAILTLGFQEIRNLVLLTATYDFVNRGPEQRLYYPLWEHFVTVAIAAKHIAENWVTSTSSHAHLAGLLHDLGKVVFAIRFPDQYYKILTDKSVGPGETIKLERQAFGCDHLQVGRMMLEQWTFPDTFIAVAGGHHGTEEEEDPDPLLQVIELSDLMAYVIHGRGISPEHALGLLRRLGVPQQAWRELPRQVRERIKIEREALEKP